MPSHSEGSCRNCLASDMALGIPEFGDLYAHIEALFFGRRDRWVVLGQSDQQRIGVDQSFSFPHRKRSGVVRIHLFENA